MLERTTVVDRRGNRICYKFQNEPKRVGRGRGSVFSCISGKVECIIMVMTQTHTKTTHTGSEECILWRRNDSNYIRLHVCAHTAH
jgi:hypothetical protein